MIKKYLYLIAWSPDFQETARLRKEDLNCTRNLLFLSKNIEKAFDKLQISFIKSTDNLEFNLFLKIWDSSVYDMPIWLNSEHTIGKYNGCKLNGRRNNPFKRALSYQAYQAFIKCRLVGETQPPLHYGTQIGSDFDHHAALMKESFYRDVDEEAVDNERN
eukprot:gene4807-9585_t